MAKKQLLVSSDHHANWQAIEQLYQYAKEHNIPFVINGDIIGDYNFDQIAKNLSLNKSYELEDIFFTNRLGKELYNHYQITKEIIKNKGDLSPYLRSYPKTQHQQIILQIQEIINKIASPEIKKKIKDTQNEFNLKATPIVQDHKIRLQALYRFMVKHHAKIFAQIIDKYQVTTYFVNGNHEPFEFEHDVNSFLKNKSLFIQLDKQSGITNINGINCVGLPNVSMLMPFLYDIYSEDELRIIHKHQKELNRPIISTFSDKDTFKQNKHIHDPDWIRIAGDKTPEEIRDKLDILFTHGQVGRGAWRENRFANEQPTLYVAALLSELAKLTVDGHLHTTHEMKNTLGKRTIRAVGNKGYLITKNRDDTVTHELIEVDAPYNARGGMDYEEFDLDEEIEKEILEHHPDYEI